MPAADEYEGLTSQELAIPGNSLLAPNHGSNAPPESKDTCGLLSHRFDGGEPFS